MKTTLSVEKLKQLAAEGVKLTETAISLDDSRKRDRVGEIRRARGLDWMESVLLCTLPRPSLFRFANLSFSRAETETLILADRAEWESQNKN